MLAAMLLWAAISLPVSAAAQEQEPEADDEQTPDEDADNQADEPTTETTLEILDDREVRELSQMEVADQVARENRVLNVRRVSLSQAARAEEGADQFAPWVLNADAEYNHRDQPTRDTFSEGLQIIDTFDFSVGAGTAWSYGTELTINFLTSIRRSETPLVIAIDGSDRRVVGPLATSALTVSATQHLLKGGSHEFNTLAESAAQEQVDAATLALEQDASSKVLEALEAYWDLRGADGGVGVSERSIVLLDQQREITQELIDAGKIAEIELDVIAQQRLTAEEGLLLAVLRREQTELQFRKVSGYPMPGARRLNPTDPDTVVFYGKDDAENLVDMAKERSFAVRAIEQQLETARLEVVRAEEELRPTLDLTVSLTQQGLDPDVGISNGLFFDAWKQVALLEFGAIGVGMFFSMPLDNQRAEADLDGAEIEILRLEAELAEAEATVEVSLRSLLQAAERYQTRIALNTRSVELARSNLENGGERFKAGQITTLDLLQLQEQLADAENELLTSRIDAIKVQLQVLHATGQLLDRFGLEVAELEAGSLQGQTPTE